MRRIVAIMLAAVLVFCGLASAESPKAPDYILEGYDGESTSRVWETNRFFERMQETTGISFQFRQYNSYSNWKERKEEMIRGNDLPDVLFKAELTPAETQKMYEAGVLIDLTPYLQEYAPDLWTLLQDHPEWMKAISFKDRKDNRDVIAALPAFNHLQNNDYMWINTKWLELLGLQTPTTADELKEVLHAFRDQDPNGNSGRDEVPLTFIGMWELRFLGHAFGIIDNDYYVSVRDGKVISSLDTDENRAFLEWLHTLWDEGLLDHKGFSMTESMRAITDTNKKIPYGMMMAVTPLSVIPAASASDYSILAPMTYEGQQVYRDLTGDVIRGTFAITSACKEPERMVSWVNSLYTEEGSRTAQYGKDGEEFRINPDGTWEWIDDLTTVAQIVLRVNTIGTGSAAPGIALEDFQLQYSDNATRRNIEMMEDMRKYCVMPYPYVYLSEEDAAEISRIQKDLMDYAELTMACFVTGDLELNDGNWKTFCETVHDKGLDDAIAIWQKYIQ